VQLRTIETINSPEKLLLDGSADLVIHSAETRSSEFFTIDLPAATTLSCVRKDHPITESLITLKQFLSYPHLRYYIPGFNTDNQGLIDLRLANLGKKRNIRYDGSDMATLLQITRDSDCIFSFASIKGIKASQIARTWSELRILQCPSELNMNELPMAIVGLSIRESDPALAWLSNEIKNIFKSSL
jgi:hypothetical protein